MELQSNTNHSLQTHKTVALNDSQSAMADVIIKSKFFKHYFNECLYMHAWTKPESKIVGFSDIKSDCAADIVKYMQLTCFWCVRCVLIHF